MPFRSVFVAVVIGTALVVAAMVINARRPRVEREQPSQALVEASGKCAGCHLRETAAIVRQFEGSRHTARGVTCLDCHRPAEGQPSVDHRGFVIARALTAKNCAQCHAREYEQYTRSRHAAPSWAAVNGPRDFSPEQLALGEKWHKGWVDRAANPIGQLEGQAALAGGCNSCHAIGKPNADGSFGTCTSCHARHAASVELARMPSTCGQCHMGPDHSQIEIYEESKHGALFAAQREHMNLQVEPARLTTAEMSVPTCATCHMSGLDGAAMTHDTTERLSWYLFAPVSTKRPEYLRGQTAMKDLCNRCHARSSIDAFFTRAESVLQATNQKVQGIVAVMDGLRKEGLVPARPFSTTLQFEEFDAWHYYGRTAKHGAFMGGADFVQWHGNYELLRKRIAIDDAARALRAARGHP